MPLAPLVTLKSRREFLRIRGGARWGTTSLLLEARRREQTSASPDNTAAGDSASNDTATASERYSTTEGPARFGFTVTKKLGNAVVRNRIRRRLREAVRQCAATLPVAGCDYVIVAREAALRRPSHALSEDLETALREVNKRLLQPQRRASIGRPEVGRKGPPPGNTSKQKTHREKK